MFILTKISDLVQITPEDLKKSSREAIEDNINAKYANKVIQKIGLCICMYDLISCSDGLIGHGTGIVNVNVEFRLIVFRPFKFETLFGKISSSTTTGIKIRTDFFDEIFVPHDELPDRSYFDHGLQLWVWPQEDEDAALYFDHHEVVRFKVESEEWHDQEPVGPNGRDNDVLRKSPYRIIGSMKGDVLGPVIWWDMEAEQEEEAPEHA